MTVALMLGLFLSQAGQAVLEGTLKDASGAPRTGVRVAAIASLDGGAELLMNSSSTNEKGSYRLEVPAGSYHITGGRLECPTYYPGTPDKTLATPIEVPRGASKSGLDFVAATESLYQRTVLLGNVQPCREAEWPPILKAFLDGATHSMGTARFFFSFVGTDQAAVRFRTDSDDLSYDCLDCSFLIKDTHAAAPTGNAGILFRRGSTASQPLDFTCQASSCVVISIPSTGVPSVVRLKSNERGRFGSSDQTAFVAIP